LAFAIEREIVIARSIEITFIKTFNEGAFLLFIVPAASKNTNE